MKGARPAFFLDEDLHGVLSVSLRKRGYDALNAFEAGRLGVSDESQLAFAAAAGRSLVTFNVGDFVLLHNRWVEAEREHAGIVVSKQLPVGLLLKRLLAVVQTETRGSLRGQIRFL